MPNISAGIRWSDNTSALKASLTDGLNSITRSVSQVKSELKDATSVLNDLQKAAAKYTDSAGNLPIPQLAADLEKQRAAVQALKDELSNLQAQSKASADGTKGFSDASRTAADSAKQAGDNSKGAADGIKSAGDAASNAQANLRQMATAFSTLGRDLTAVVTVPIVSAAAASVTFAADFETQMTRVQTLAGASKSEVDAMGKSILELSPEVGVGPEELAKGLFVIESAGMRGAKAMDVLTTSAKMSALGMGQTDDVARAVVGTMLAYTDQNLSAAQAGDILVKTVQLGNMKIDELVPALAKVNPVAAAMGIKFQDVAAALATFTHMGASSSVAATGLRAILSNILTDSAKTEKGFQQLSATLNDSSISMQNFKKAIQEQGLAGALIDLMNKATSAGDAGSEALNKIFPNIRALTEVLAIAGPQADNYRRILDGVNDSTGAVNDAMSALDKTTAQQWAKLTDQLKVLAIEIGDDLLPQVKALINDVLKPGVTDIEAWVKAFEALPTPVKTFAEILVGIGVAGGPVLLALGSVARAITAIQLLLFGANAAAETSVFGALMKLGGLVGLGAGGAAGAGAEAGSEAALAALTAKVRAGASGLGLSGWMGLVPATTLKYDLTQEQKDELTRKYYGLAAAPVSPFELSQLGRGYMPGQASYGTPADQNAPGFVAGGVVDLSDRTAATLSLKAAVAALTTEQKNAIDADKAAGLSVKEIAADLKQAHPEWQLSADVIGVYERQVTSASKSSKQAAKDIAAAWKETEQNIADSEKTGEQAAQAVAKGLTDGQNLLMKLGQTMGDITLPGIAGPTETGVDVIGAGVDQMGKNLEHALNQVATLMPALKPEAQQAIADALLPPEQSSFGDELYKNLSTTLDNVPKIIEQAFTGGGGLQGAVQAIGADIGAGLGRSIVGAIPGSMTSLLGDKLGGIADELLPGIGGALGSLLGKALSALFNIGGPSQAELQGRQTEAQFQSQTAQLGAPGTTGLAASESGLQQEFINAGYAADVASQKAQAAFAAMFAAEKQGSAAVQAVIDSVNADITAHTKAVSDGVQGVLDAAKNVGSNFPAALAPMLQQLIALPNLTDAEKQSLNGLLATATPTFDQMVSDAQSLGISIDQLGPKFQQGQVSEQADKIVQIFQELTQSGADVGGMLQGAASKLGDLVSEALKDGATLPTALQPFIKDLFDTGQLVDSTGTKITDISKLSFTDSGDPLTNSINTLTQALDSLIQLLGGQLPAAAQQGATGAANALNNTLGQFKPPTIHVPVTFDQTNAPPTSTTEPGPTAPGPVGVAGGGLITAFGVRRFAYGGVVPQLGFQYFEEGGTAGPMPIGFRPIGSDTVPAMLTPGEWVFNAVQQDQMNRLFSAGASMASDLVKTPQTAGHPTPADAAPPQPIVFQTFFNNRQVAQAMWDGTEQGGKTYGKATKLVRQMVKP